MESTLAAGARPSRWRLIARTIVLAAVAGTCLWWAAILIGPEHFWLTAGLLYVPYWLLLPPLILAAGIAWPLGWAWRGAALAALLIALGPVMGFAWGQGDEGAGRIRLMTYNVKAYLAIGEVGGFDGIIAEIRQHDPDIIVMQDAATMGHMDDPAYRQLARDIVGARAVYIFGQYVVASRLPLHGCKVGDISYDDVTHTLVSCVVRAHGRDIDLYTAHFISPRDGLNAFRWQGIMGYGEWTANVEARMLQADKLAALVAKRGRPAIVAGDLNAPEQSLVVRRLLDTGLRDAFSRAGWGYGYTHGHSLKPHISSTLRIDHILVSQEIGVEDCFVGGKEGSEHRPVIADLLVY